VTHIPLPLRSNPAAVRFVGETRLYNCYPEEVGQENRSPVNLRCIPGQSLFSNVTDVASRGMIEMVELGAVYSVHGFTVYKILADGTKTAISGVIPGSLPVVMERGQERFMSSEVQISAATPAVITWPLHRLPADTPIQFTTDGTLPTGVTANTTYYVLAAGLTPNSFRISLTVGGAAINTSGGQTGVHTATRTTPTYQVAIVSDESSYCLEDDALSLIDLPEQANSVTFLAQRFIYGCDSGRAFYSEINDCLDVPPLNKLTAEARPDGMVRAFADIGELWLLGTKTTEIWRAAPDADLPFAPLGGTFIPKGCAARDSVCSFDNAVVWLGNDGIVYRGAAYNAERMSDHATERAVKTVSDQTTIKAYVDVDEGHSFYVLTCDAWTWAFDAATKLWHERVSYQRVDWRAWPYCVAFGKRLVGDKASGVLNELSNAVLTESGDPIVVRMILPDVPGPLTFNALELDLAKGQGLGVPSTTLGYDPTAMLRWSDDGGYTWSSERTLSAGREGQWNLTVKFTRLGTARTKRGRRFEISMSDPVLKSFTLGDIDAEPLAA